MSDRATASRLIAEAARSHLRPLGLQRKGRSRFWFGDESWWTVNVEFQPSLNPGTYLNVGAMWLWYDKNYWSFDEGNRLRWRADGTFNASAQIGERGWRQFLEYRDAEQFGRDIHMIANIAKQRALQLRQQFRDPCAAARVLTGRKTQLGESPGWHTYHAGAAAALCGDAAVARHAFASIKMGSLDPDWAHELANRAATLANLAHDPEALRQRIVQLIQACRHKLGLPPATMPSNAGV